MNNLSDIKKTNKLKKLFKLCDDYNLGASGYDNYGHRACHFIKQHNQLHILHTYINLEDVILNLYQQDLFSDVDCGFYNERNAYETEYIFPKLLELMEKKQIIFIIMDLGNYYVIKEKNPNKKGYHKQINTPQIHSVCLILHPYDNYMYDVFYINSHGNGICEETVFEQKISNTRKKEYVFKQPINSLLIQTFVNRLREYVSKHFSQPNFKQTLKICYTSTSKHNYYGCNFQNGDYHGVCFVFPLIIWYYFNKYYYVRRVVGKRKTYIIDPISHLLKTKRLDLFVKSCFLEFSDHFGQLLLTQRDYCLDEYIQKKHTHLVKKILSKYVYFIIQPEICKNITAPFTYPFSIRF